MRIVQVLLIAVLVGIGVVFLSSPKQTETDLTSIKGNSASSEGSIKNKHEFRAHIDKMHLSTEKLTAGYCVEKMPESTNMNTYMILLIYPPGKRDLAPPSRSMFTSTPIQMSETANLPCYMNHFNEKPDTDFVIELCGIQQPKDKAAPTNEEIMRYTLDIHEHISATK